MPNDVIKIILADDHELFRDGFTSLIDKCPGIELVAQTCNGKHLVELTEKLLPDVVLTDIMMPDMNGIEATREISKKFPGVGIIVISMFNESYMLKDMLEAGAIGYLLKNASKEELVSAINSVYKNRPFFCNDTTIKLAKLHTSNTFSHNVENQLTEKEKEVILYICRGMANKDIAEKMYLSIRTIEGYREKIMQKTKTTKVAGLVLYAIVNHFIFVDANQQVHPYINPPLIKSLPIIYQQLPEGKII